MIINVSNILDVVRHIKIVGIILFGILNAINNTYSQSEFPNITYRNITTKDGLTSNIVYGFAQGDDGQMWIGTINGLNSFDGNTINNYFKGNHPTIKLSSNIIWSMAKSHKNELWISDRNSICKISLTNFHSEIINQLKDAKFSRNSQTNEIYLTSNEGVYKIIDQNIINLNIEKPLFKHLGKEIFKYEDVIIDNNQHLYLKTKGMIYQTDLKYNIQNRFPYPLKGGITNLYFSSNNKLWVASWGDGILLLNTDTNKFISIFNDMDSKSIIQNFNEWRINNSTYIVASYSSEKEQGFVVINPLTYEYKIYNLNTTVHNSFVDMDGNLWLGTDNGIFIVSNLQEIVQNIPITTKQPQLPLGFGNVYTIKETKDHFWLTKRYGHGIFKYDKNWNLIKEFGRFTIANHPITHFIADGYDFIQRDNKMYSTTDLGMFIIDNNTHQRLHILPKDKSELKLRTIIPYNDTLWLLRSFEKGIIGFNPKKNNFSDHYLWSESLTHLVNNYIFKTKDGAILTSTNYGLYVFDVINKMYVKINNDYFNGIGVYGIAEDSNEKLWICTDNGLIQYDLKSNHIISDFKQFPEMGKAYRVAVDHNNVWFSNAKGFWCWDQSQKKMIKLNHSSGLINESGENCILICNDQKVLLGSRDMVHIIDSSFLNRKNPSKSLIVTKFLVNNEEKQPKYQDSKYFLELAQGKFTIQIFFAVPDFSMENSYYYEFKFDDDKNWSKANDGKVFLPNLGSGNYRLWIKGISNFSGSETALTSLTIHISPYWYQTFWFKIILLLFLLTSMYLVYLWRLTNERTKNKLKADYENKMLNLEMQNLRSQMNPHFIFNSLNSINSFIVENKTHLASDYLTKFSKLIRMILEHSKNEVIPLSKELEALNLYVMMEKNRFQQSFDFEIDIDKNLDLEYIDVPPLILQPYIENAIWHGLMHQKIKGKIKLSITNSQNVCIFTIIDNGIGRQRAMELKSKKNVKSVSYGMDITKTRIESHNPFNKVEVSDIKDAEGYVCGTMVTLSIHS